MFAWRKLHAFANTESFIIQWNIFKYEFSFISNIFITHMHTRTNIYLFIYVFTYIVHKIRLCHPAVYTLYLRRKYMTRYWTNLCQVWIYTPHAIWPWEQGGDMGLLLPARRINGLRNQLKDRADINWWDY